MFSTFFTRNGDKAIINGMSQYYQFGSVTIYSGNVDDQDVTWDEHGRYKMNQLFGDKLPHELDLVGFVNDEVDDPGIYYVELKK